MIDDSDGGLQSGENDEPDYSKIPRDFPRPEVGGAVSGFQSKLLLTSYQGKFYAPGCTPPELYARWDRCEDLAQQLAGMSELEILDQYLPRLIATKWTSEAEARFIIRRAAKILGWPTPAAAQPDTN